MQSKTHQQLLQAVAEYHMPTKARELVIASELLIICGVTAAGKNTIVNYLIDNDEFACIVSHTTRLPRENHGILEKNGRDYWFVDESKMLELANQNAFVEIKQVHGTTFYGTSIMAVEQAVQSGKRPITEIDVQGVLVLMAELPSLQPLFVMPPSYEAWMERLSNRGTIGRMELQQRLMSAESELRLAIDNPQFELVVNHEFHYTVAEIIHGIDMSKPEQAKRRELAKTLLESIASLGIGDLNLQD